MISRSIIGIFDELFLLTLEKNLYILFIYSMLNKQRGINFDKIISFGNAQY